MVPGKLVSVTAYTEDQNLDFIFKLILNFVLDFIFWDLGIKYNLALYIFDLILSFLVLVAEDIWWVVAEAMWCYF